MSFLGVDHHRINSERVYLPFPPVSAFTSYLIHGIPFLQHQSFAPLFSGLQAETGQFIPVVESNSGRQPKGRVIDLLHYFLQK
jgi:hypothetical protein